MHFDVIESDQIVRFHFQPYGNTRMRAHKSIQSKSLIVPSMNRRWTQSKTSSMAVKDTGREEEIAREALFPPHNYQKMRRSHLGKNRRKKSPNLSLVHSFTRKTDRLGFTVSSGIVNRFYFFLSLYFCLFWTVFFSATTEREKKHIPD